MREFSIFLTMYDGGSWPSVEHECRAFCGRGRGFAACCTFSSLSPSYLFMRPFWDAGCCGWAAPTSEKSVSITKQQLFILRPVFLSDHTFILAFFFLWILTYCCYHFLLTRDSISPLHPPLTHPHFEPFHSLPTVSPMTNVILSTQE